MIYRTPTVQPEEAAVLERIRGLRTKLEFIVREPRRWNGLLRRTTFARNIQGSNSIEGYNVTVEDAIAAAEGEEPFSADQEDFLAVSGYRQAMTFVIQLAGDPVNVRYSADILRSLHYMMMQHDLSKSPGSWRVGYVGVQSEVTGETVYEGPDAGLVPELIEELVGALNDDQEAPVMVRAAMAHLNLVMIHPFRDGNGRMARCLQTLVLAQEGILAPIFSSIEEYLGRNTREYYDVLAEVGQGRWNPQHDARPWVRFCLVAHYRQATTLLRRMDRMGRIWNELEQAVQRYDIPERTILALADAATGLAVRNATYRTAVADISDQTASRDLRKLCDVELLVPHGEKRGRYYTAGAEVRAIADAIPRVKQVEDPFDLIQAELPGIEP